MKNTLFTGSAVAIVTPFDERGNINFEAFASIIDYQIEHGTDAIVVCGTTGEDACLTHEEHTSAIKFCVNHVNKRVPVIAGTGSNSTQYAIYLSQEAENLGVDGLLSVTPYYNKTSQDGLIAHYTAIADHVHTPIILYNVPSRTGLNILPQTYQVLAGHENICGIKEANGNISALADTMALCGDKLDVYSGNDDQVTSFLSLGAKGVISVVSNILPQLMHDMVMSYLDGDPAKSRALQLEYIDLCHALFSDVNPIPVKEAMNMMGIRVGNCRLPLTRMNEAKREALQAVLQKHGLLK